MKWFAKNVLWVHLFALVMAFCWIHGGTRADLLVPVIPWLTLLVLEWLLVFPQTKTTETLAESRRRVWRSLVRDPLLYVSLVLTVLLIIPLFNVAAAPSYDDAIKQWVVPKPSVVWLPHCVNWTQHAVLLLWFPPVLLAALASKHGLLKKGKRMLLEGICWNGAALALVGFAQLLSGTGSLLWLTPMKGYFFSAFGYSNFAGAFFTLTAAISFGLWFHQVTEEAGQAPVSFSSGEDDERPALLYTHRMLIPTVLMFAGAIASLSRAAILLSTVVFVVLTLYMLCYVWKRVTVGMRVTLVSVLGALVFAVGVSLLVFKLESLKRELQTITPSAVIERVTGSGYYHARVAKEIFRDHPVFGVGGWGYPRYMHQYLTPEDIKKLQIEGGANVHNDSLQLLAEQGAVGYGLLLASVLLLVFPLCRQAWLVSRARVAAGVKDEPAKEKGWLCRVPAPLVAVWVGTSATVCHSLGDLPFRAPSILIVWVLALSCVPGWLPAVKNNRP